MSPFPVKFNSLRPNTPQRAVPIVCAPVTYQIVLFLVENHLKFLSQYISRSLSADGNDFYVFYILLAFNRKLKCKVQKFFFEVKNDSHEL